MAMTAITIKTKRLHQHLHMSGSADMPALLMIHGNASSSVFWKEIGEKLSASFFCLAPDLRGYGETEDLLIDAKLGFGDFIADLIALLDHYGIKQCHVMGHSLGGGIIWPLLASAPERFLSAVLVNPASPYGFGGTKDECGTPCFPDFAGSGGGIVNPEFARLIAQKDRSSENPQASPRVVMNSFYWKPPFVPHWEEELLDSVLTEKIGPERYPGDFVASENYPFVAPGQWGPINASSPKYLDNSVKDFITATTGIPVLWLRGAADLIVSDNSLFDFGTLGKMGYVPNYPGEAVYPPQPMLSQTRYVLDKRREKGGIYQEVVMADTGHTPFIEQPDEFLQHLLLFLKAF